MTFYRNKVTTKGLGAKTYFQKSNIDEGKYF